jgi:hypothetical protein
MWLVMARTTFEAISMRPLQFHGMEEALMLTRNKPVPILCSALLTTALVATPYELAFDSQSPHLQAQSAWAKDGGKGGGNGGGNGNAGGNGGGNGNAGGNGGNNGNAGKNDNAGPSGNARGETANRFTPDTRESVNIDGPAMEVRHTNGMSERIADGRYMMKDAKGRTIINRTATSSDRSRLQSFAR